MRRMGWGALALWLGSAACGGGTPSAGSPGIAPGSMEAVVLHTVEGGSSPVSRSTEQAGSPDAGAPGPDTSAPTDDELTLTAAPSGAFAGSSGNVPGDSGITSIWGAGDLVVVVGNGFVFRSSDRGLHFKRIPLAVRFPVVWGASKEELFVAGERNVFRSTDGGATFAPTGAPRGSISALWGRSKNEIYAAGGAGDGGPPFVARSNDQGASWAALPTPVQGGWLSTIASTGAGDLLVGGSENVRAASGQQDVAPVLLRSTDGGKTWKRLPTFKRNGSNKIGNLCFASGVLFASSAYELHMTRDLGATWKLATPVGTEILALACRGRDVIVGGRNRALHVSRDLGATWDKNPIGSAWTHQSLVSAQAAFLSETGEAYVGYEGLYDEKHGSLFRRSP